jgi:hypothetical protein
VSQATHTLAAGQSIQQIYGSFGATGTAHFNTPLNSIVLYCGLPKQGKSRFLQGYEGALIINSDLGPQYHPRCQVWPHMSTDPERPGPITSTGSPFNFSWDSIRELETQLLDAAKNKRPRPRVVHFDSLTTCYEMVKQWVATKLNFPTFQDITESRRAYEAAYSELIRIFNSLKNAGYGVGVVVHLTYINIPIDDGGKTAQRLDVAITDGLYKRLFPLADLMMGISCFDHSTPITREITLANGTKMKKSDVRIESRLRVQASQPGLEKVFGRRVQLPDQFDVPNDHTAFTEFLKIYDKCVADTVSASASPSPASAT